MNTADAAAVADVARRHAATRHVVRPDPATGDSSRVAGGADGGVETWRLRREAAATERALLCQRVAAQRAFGATLRAERDDVQATAQRLVAATARIRRAVCVGRPQDPACGVPADLPPMSSTSHARGLARAEETWR